MLSTQGRVVGFRGNGLLVKQSFSPPLNPTLLVARPAWLAAEDNWPEAAASLAEWVQGLQQGLQ
ncbi:MAG: hypothetical protein Q7U74_03380 [Saprospiraceae bacterium]|nr:hypothetical protein [Saprospiraceae bacterium]